MTALGLWKPICPSTMSPVFLRLDHSVYETLTSGSLRPLMELCLTSCAQSCRRPGSMPSSVFCPLFRRRYTWALLIESTWNQTSSGIPYLISSSFSVLSLPMYNTLPSRATKKNTILKEAWCLFCSSNLRRKLQRGVVSRCISYLWKGEDISLSRQSARSMRTGRMG
ncbi:MAG: hypothetical protein Q8P67_00080 [archaeon]|nr:hypothetical protein [archaeon]